MNARVYIRLCYVVVLALAWQISPAILVSSQAEYFEAAKNLVPGDMIVLANGTWHDFEIVLEGQGEQGKPITLTAQTPGRVFISGRSNLRMAGEHLVVSGLIFKDGYTPTNTVIAFRRTKGKLANHSRVTDVVIDRYNNPERHETDFWVMMYGKHNRFDHNYLAGKSNVGVTMAVRLDSPESQENHHRIDHNFFGYRPILGSNGGETLRIGTSKYSLTESHTLVESNYFERCNGEVEIVSSKSGSNVFRGNVFLESRGTLTLRHGNGNLIENNVFLGNQAPHTGGIRVINKRQQIRNNYLYGLTGHRFGGGLVIMNGVPNSPINRYHQVEESSVHGNSIIDVSHIELAAGSDEERSAPPISSTFKKNLIYNTNEKNNIAVHDDVSGIEFAENLTNIRAPKDVEQGFEQEDFELTKSANGLLYPTLERPDPSGVSKDLQVLDRDKTGPSWYTKPPPLASFDTGQEYVVSTNEGALSAAVEKARPGDIVVLTKGTYVEPTTLTIQVPLTIRAEEPAAAELTFERNALFEIEDGGALKLDGLTISGTASPDMVGNSLIRTKRRSMLTNYSLVIVNTTIRDLNTNHSFNVLSPAKHTFANSIRIDNSTFENITGTVLQLNPEIDDLGIYSAENIVISNSMFRNIDGAVANIYRGGTDESTFGPHVHVTNSVVENTGLGSRNKAKASFRLWGVQDTDILTNTFNQSAPIWVTHTVGDPVTVLSENKFVDTAEPTIDIWQRN